MPIQFASVSYAPVPAAPPPDAVPVPVSRDHDATELVRRDGTDQVFLPVRNLRPFVIGIVALGVVSLGIVLGITIAHRSGSGSSSKAAKPTAGSAAAKPGPVAAKTPVVAPTNVDAAPAATAPPDDWAVAVAATPPDAAPPDPEPTPVEPRTDPEPTPVEPEADPAPTPVAAKPAKGQCAVAFTSTPPGASIVIAGHKHGKTPATVTLPCARATVVYQRPRYANLSKPFSPKEGATTKVSARLERPTFTLRVVSSPPNATVTVQGRSSGKSPVTAKVPGFEAVTVKVTKPGYQAKTTKVTAKKNGTVVTVTLRRGN
jgi:hypothetical protein